LRKKRFGRAVLCRNVEPTPGVSIRTIPVSRSPSGPLWRCFDSQPITRILRLGKCGVPAPRDGGSINRLDRRFAIRKGDPDPILTARANEGRQRRHRRHAGRQQGRAEERVEQGALAAFELADDRDPQQALVETRLQFTQPDQEFAVAPGWDAEWLRRRASKVRLVKPWLTFRAAGEPNSQPPRSSRATEADAA